jgi:hypothetical protein
MLGRAGIGFRVRVRVRVCEREARNKSEWEGHQGAIYIKWEGRRKSTQAFFFCLVLFGFETQSQLQSSQ